MVKVFLCHSSLDKPFVLDFAKNLEQHGVECWIDEIDMLPGDGLISNISEAIKREDFVLAFISNNSVKSHFVQYELEQGMTKEISAGKDVIIPIKIDECAMPGFLEHKIYADFTKRERYISEFNRILKKLCVIGKKGEIKENNIAIIKNELKNRFTNINAEKLPVKFDITKPLIFLALKPVNRTNIDMKKFDKFLFYPIQCVSDNHRIIQGGYIGYDKDSYEEEHRVYVYVTNDGYLETLNNRISENPYGGVCIDSQYYEEETREALSSYLKKYKELSIALPLILFFGMMNIKNLTFSMAFRLVRQKLEDGYDFKFPNSSFISKPVYINNYSNSVDFYLKPIFDEIWQIFGYVGSMNYEDEEWVGQDRFR